MPNRNIVGDYRYDYQGQEKDEETGKHAFELRLYDSRINRWLTVDPYRQFSSPYLSMGNNWVNFIDTDGGYCTDADGNSIPCPDGYSSFEGPTPETYVFEQWDDGTMVYLDPSTTVNLGWQVNVKMDGYLGQTQFWMSSEATIGEYWDKKAEALQKLHNTNWFFINSVVQTTVVASGAISFGGANTTNRSYSFKGGLASKVNPYSLTPTQPITLSRREFQDLVNQIKSEGIKTPVEVSVKDGFKYIVNGHHRVYIAKRLGIEDIPVKFVPFKSEHAMMQSSKNPGFLNYIKY